MCAETACLVWPPQCQCVGAPAGITNVVASPLSGLCQHQEGRSGRQAICICWGPLAKNGHTKHTPVILSVTVNTSYALGTASTLSNRNGLWYSCVVEGQ